MIQMKNVFQVLHFARSAEIQEYENHQRLGITNQMEIKSY